MARQRRWKIKNNSTKQRVFIFLLFFLYPFLSCYLLLCFKFSAVSQASLGLLILLFLPLCAEIININYHAKLSCLISVGAKSSWHCLHLNLSNRQKSLAYPKAFTFNYSVVISVLTLPKVLKTNSYLPFYRYNKVSIKESLSLSLTHINL